MESFCNHGCQHAEEKETSEVCDSCEGRTYVPVKKVVEHTKRMIRVCSACQDEGKPFEECVLGETPLKEEDPIEDGTLTHGICAEHLEKILAVIDEEEEWE